jgi:hypothetical protein
MTMQQSFELLFKAYLVHQKLWNPDKDRGHDLIVLLQKGKKSIPVFSSMLKDKDTTDFFKQLSDGYLTVRYGEHWLSVKKLKLINLYDNLIIKLVNDFQKLTGIRGAELFIFNQSTKTLFTTGIEHRITKEITVRSIVQVALD